jgi:uncharacterized protein YcaQ
MRAPVRLDPVAARRIWIAAQRLDEPAPFGEGPEATLEAVEHLGYVQIDTINVVERCHHHILWSRIPAYRREDLATCQSVDKSIFEYWTHALAYIPTRDIRFFLGAMAAYRKDPGPWFRSVKDEDLRKVMRLLKTGPVSIRDIDDDVLVEKDHAWASRKPSRRALQLAFFSGLATVSARSGMLKTYDLLERHFGWQRRPRPATARQRIEYLLDRALRAQGIVSLDSICHLEAGSKPAVRALIETRMRSRKLVPVVLEGHPKAEHWAPPSLVEREPPESPLVHILSPFDPLIIQRKRLELFFGYRHLFEAYVPKEKRKLGYFALPVLAGDEIVAAIDLKSDRAAGKLLIQQWTWVGKGSAASHKAMVEDALGRFEAFQLPKG